MQGSKLRTHSVPAKRITEWNKFRRRLYRQRMLLVLLLPAFLITFVFHYIPLSGLVISFKKYNVGKGIWGSDWVGLRWFIQFFKNPYAARIIRNTIVLGTLNFSITFPAPIILSLLFNEISSTRFKKLVQTVSYLPHFISTVILVGMLKAFSANNGLLNQMIHLFGGETILFFTRSEWFRTLYVVSSLWQGLGWGTIIYLAALAGISPELYESAVLDGANRWQRIRYITIPGMMPTIITLFILAIPGMISTDTDKILLMYSPATYETADVIGTYVYREGFEGANFSYSSAVSLIMSLVSFALIYITNWASRTLSETSLW